MLLWLILSKFKLFNALDRILCYDTIMFKWWFEKDLLPIHRGLYPHGFTKMVFKVFL